MRGMIFKFSLIHASVIIRFTEFSEFLFHLGKTPLCFYVETLFFIINTFGINIFGSQTEIPELKILMSSKY